MSRRRERTGVPGIAGDPYELFDVAGRVGVVTGAGSGIGRALAHGLAGAGMTVVAADVDDRGVVETVRLADPGAAIVPAHCDVSREDEVDDLLSTTRRDGGEPDLLVTNAAAFTLHPALDLPPDEWRRVIDVNLTGTFLCAQVFGRAMARQRRGCIVTVGSQLARVMLPDHAAYCASKAGVEMLTRALAHDLAPYGIRVNCLAPGPVETERTRPLLHEGPGREWFRGRLLLDRYAVPADLLGAVIFLASAASGYMTGSTLVVDGGYLTT
jgi:NAD(P)-dependent dehydrogenase (short-subunit alcohol dehydrogenase family)